MSQVKFSEGKRYLTFGNYYLAIKEHLATFFVPLSFDYKFCVLLFTFSLLKICHYFYLLSRRKSTLLSWTIAVRSKTIKDSGEG